MMMMLLDLITLVISITLFVGMRYDDGSIFTRALYSMTWGQRLCSVVFGK